MTALGRALFGGALGALLTLCVHPASRSYLQSAFRRTSASSLDGAVNLDHSSLPRPSNRVAVGVWVLLAAEKLNTGAKLTRSELKSLTRLTEATERIDPENAFWPQMCAVFYAHAGDPAAARGQWQRASRCKSWNDEQTRRLLKAHQVLASLTDSDQSWLYGYVYFARSDSAANQIEIYARSLIKNTTVESHTGLLTRFITIRNGSLLRDGSRSVSVGTHGREMVELATYPPLLLNTEEDNRRHAKRIWIAQTHLTSRLKEVGLTEESEEAESDFNQNDAWTPLIPDRSHLESNVRNLCFAAIALSSLPGILALTFAFGGLVYILGSLNQERLAKMRLFPTYGVAVGAGVFAGAVFETSLSWIAAMAAALCVAFLAMGPFVPRKRRTNDLGPLFTFTLLFLWIIGVTAFSMYASSTSTAASNLLPKLGPMGEYLGDAPMFAGVAGITLAVMCMTAPAWAVVLRYGTPDLLGLVLRRFGKIAMFGGLLLCVTSGPLCVYADSVCRSQLAQIVENEPNYYLIQ